MKKLTILSAFLFGYSLTAIANNLDSSNNANGLNGFNNKQAISIAPTTLNNKNQGLGFNTNLYSVYTNFNGVNTKPGFLQIKGNLSANGKEFTQVLPDNIVFDPDTDIETWVSFANLNFKVSPDYTITGNIDYIIYPVFVNHLDLTGKYNPLSNTYTLQQTNVVESDVWKFTVYPKVAKPLQ